VRLRHIAGAVCVGVAVASGLALAHFDNMPAFIVLAPGYLVQSWLFERHWAPGGIGYEATMIGVSAVVWTVILFVPALAFQWMWKRLRRSL
jgi:hypothetical protein